MATTLLTGKSAVMGMICRELLKLPTLRNIKVVAGSNGLEKTIRWVYASECFEDTREIVDWLYGGELVFITGRDIKDNEALLLDLIQKIHNKSVAGLLINIGPYISEIPQKAIALADELAFPVLTIPWESKLVDITREICEAIFMKEMEEKSIDNLLESILFGDTADEESLIDKAAYYGYDLNATLMMGMINIHHFEEYLKKYELKDEINILQMKTNFKRIIQEVLIRNNRKALVMQRMDSVILLLKVQPNDKEALSRIAQQIKQDADIKLGGMNINFSLGNSYSRLSEMKKSLKEAEQALKIADMSKEPKLFYRYSDLGLYSIIFNTKDEKVLEDYYHSVMGQLVEYDRINDSDLIKTLEMFISENCNMTVTAEKLYIHRNTLKYRINKIEELTNYDLRDIKDLTKLDISLMIGRYIKALD